jgi:hypothetical protein
MKPEISALQTVAAIESDTHEACAEAAASTCAIETILSTGDLNRGSEAPPIDQAEHA